MKAKLQHLKTGQRATWVKISFMVSGEMLQEVIEYLLSDYPETQISNTAIEKELRRLLWTEGINWFDFKFPDHYRISGKAITEAKRLFPTFFKD